jgi:MFS family permease
LGVTPGEIGLMMAVFTAPAIVLIPFAGVLSDRYGRKPILEAGLVIFGVSGTAIILTIDFRVAIALRLLQGVGYAGLTPIIITSIGDVYSGTKEATAQGFRFAGGGLTATVFPLISGVLVVFAWQLPFLLYGLALPVAVSIYLWFDESAQSGSTADSTPDPLEDYGRRALMYRLLVQPRVIALVIARGLPGLAWVGFLTYNSIVVVQLIGGTPSQAGLVVAVGSLTLAASGSQAGQITDRFDSRFNPLFAANMLLGAGVVLLFFAWDLSIIFLGTLCMGVGVGVTLSLYRSIITSLASSQLRGGLVSISESFGQLVNTVTPIFMGGVIGLLTPVVGLQLALQIAGTAAAVLASVGGVACLLPASTSSPVQSPLEDDSNTPTNASPEE